MGLANVSGNAQNLWLSTALPEMFAIELAAGDQLRTVPAEHVARATPGFGFVLVLETTSDQKDSAMP